MVWSYDSLWQKAKRYAQRAMSEDREGPLFPFWASLALEFLGRATLAKVHPSLLADPTEGDNILYACGLGAAKTPKSVKAKTVFLRCQHIAAGFTKKDVEKTLTIVERRNAELHSGDTPFDGLQTKLWLPEYFRLCQLLLKSQQRSLDELFGAGEATAAQAMIDASDKKTAVTVKKAVQEKKKEFKALDSKVRRSKKSESRILSLGRALPHSRETICPACSCSSRIFGEVVRLGEPKAVDEKLVRDIAILPVAFECFGCGLKLSGHTELHAADLGGQYSTTETIDPVDYYAPDLDPNDYYGEEYNNE